MAQLGLGGVAGAQTAKTFIDYIKPATPVCSPLSSATWGVAGVLPRDICQGIESAQGAGVPPADYYWDGQIIRATDGKYHMFMSTWPGSSANGFGDWTSSNAFHAISTMGVEGPYMRQDYVYSSHKGHNVSAAQLLDGSYVVVVSEIVPFTIYKSTSLDGPWTACPGGELIQTNGVNTNQTTACPAGGPCNDTHWDSNVSLVARPDGKFEIVQRHGFIALADTILRSLQDAKADLGLPDGQQAQRRQYLSASNLEPAGLQSDLRVGRGSAHLVQRGHLPRHLFGLRRSGRLAHLFAGRDQPLEGRRRCLLSLGLPKSLLLRGKQHLYAVVQVGAARGGHGRWPPHPHHLGRRRRGQGLRDTERLQSR